MFLGKNLRLWFVGEATVPLGVGLHITTQLATQGAEAGDGRLEVSVGSVVRAYLKIYVKGLRIQGRGTALNPLKTFMFHGHFDVGKSQKLDGAASCE